jgi:hypothetical protein
MNQYHLLVAFLVFGLITGCKPRSETAGTKEVSIAGMSQVKHVEWSKDATIYEVNIRQYSPEGTFKAIEQDLPRLKELGVDILWLMPIFPIGEMNRKATPSVLIEDENNTWAAIMPAGITFPLIPSMGPLRILNPLWTPFTNRVCTSYWILPFIIQHGIMSG